MIARHLNILRDLCAPYSFLEVNKPTHNYRYGILVLRWVPQPTRRITYETVENWIVKGLITTSGHTVESYHITDTGRAFVAKFDEPEQPFKMATFYRAQAEAREALRGTGR